MKANLTSWPKGVSGNPKGRPKNAKTRLLHRLEELINIDNVRDLARVKYIAYYMDLQGWTRSKTKPESAEEEISLDDFRLPPERK